MQGRPAWTVAPHNPSLLGAEPWTAARILASTAAPPAGARLNGSAASSAPLPQLLSLLENCVWFVPSPAAAAQFASHVKLAMYAFRSTVLPRDRTSVRAADVVAAERAYAAVFEALPHLRGSLSPYLAAALRVPSGSAAGQAAAGAYVAALSAGAPASANEPLLREEDQALVATVGTRAVQDAIDWPRGGFCCLFNFLFLIFLTVFLSSCVLLFCFFFCFFSLRLTFIYLTAESLIAATLPAHTANDFVVAPPAKVPAQRAI